MSSGLKLRRRWPHWLPCLRGDLPLPIPSNKILLPPTGFGLFYAALVLMMMIGALNYNNNPALLLALLLASAGIVSVLLCHLQLVGLQVVSITGEPTSAGQPLPVHISLRSTAERPHQDLYVSFDEITQVRLETRECGLLHATLSLPTSVRGQLPLPSILLTTRWPIGLVQASIRLQPNVLLMVHPQPEAAPPLLHSFQTSATTTPITDGELSHIRLYRRGDARAQIAWKSSARRGQLLVRQYTGIGTTAEHLHWESVKHLPVETGISRLAYLVINAHDHQQRWSLQLPDHPLMGPDGGPAHRQRCLDALAMLPGKKK